MTLVALGSIRDGKLKTYSCKAAKILMIRME